MTNKDILRELGELDAELVLKISPEESTAKRPAIQSVYKRWIACAAMLAVLLGVFSVVGFGNVYAAVRQWLSFIPGFGVQTTLEQSVFIQLPITEKVENAGTEAELLRAGYCDGTLTVTVHIDGAVIYGQDFGLYVNGEPVRVGNHYSLAVASASDVGHDSAMLEIAVPMAAPIAEDRFEVEIAGFAERLAFSVKPCQTYAELCEIGPTVTKNGITLTVTANRIGDELIVWCYETRTAEATQDPILGYGSPVNGSNVLQRYLETENEALQDTAAGWHLPNRFVFQLSKDDTSATLHIPYLTMFREVQEDLKLSLPTGYGTIASDCRIRTDLGSICITAVERSASERGSKDTVILYLSYENHDLQRQIYSLSYDIKGNYAFATVPDGESGTAKCIKVFVDKNTDALEISANGIYYYLMDEYEIELDRPFF